ncbi:MAG: acetyl-CoA carboxylase biotin carboxyl carrier protein [Planctomycetota bacterium]
MDLSRLKELINLMNRHELEELELEEGEFRVRLRKRGEKAPEMVALPVAGGGRGLAASSGGAPAEEAVDEANLIRSPMVGTFFRAPSPDADSFVEVGDRIEEGKVLCIIEAMKVMNEIKAERSGTIEEILVSNGEPVEYSQLLFRIS